MMTHDDREARWRRYAEAVASLGGTATVKQVAAHVGEKPNAIRNWLVGCVNGGLLTRTVQGKEYTYHVTP